MIDYDSSSIICFHLFCFRLSKLKYNYLIVSFVDTKMFLNQNVFSYVIEGVLRYNLIKRHSLNIGLSNQNLFIDLTDKFIEIS